MSSFSVHFRPSDQYKNPIKKGDKVRVGDNTKRQLRSVLKKRYMVARLKKKKFEPTFVVVSVSTTPYNFSAVIKPFNF